GGALARPSRPAERDAAAESGASRAGGRSAHDPSGRSRRGVRRHVQGALPRGVHGRGRRCHAGGARLPDLRRRPPRQRPRRRRLPKRTRAGMGGGAGVKLGLLTAAFPGLSLEEIAEWAASEGFETLEIACWPAADSERRRYAGVTHLDVESLDPDQVHELLGRHGLEISSLAYYPNNLHPDDAEREAANAHLLKVVDAAQRLGVRTVGTFVGNDKDRPYPENLERFEQVWPPLVAHAAERGVRIAIENCPMIFSWGEWPGGNNLAATPAAWDDMFAAISSESFGL